MKNYLPNENVLIEIVDKFNKRNETTIGYLRNQYNALENYVVEYCKDNNKYLINLKKGTETGINFKFRSVLFEVISNKGEIINLLNSREVNTLFHFTPLIIDDEKNNTKIHEEFNEAYNNYRKFPSNNQCQKDALTKLCGLIYLVRCNAAHTGKSSFGPNRQKIERDNAIAKMIININIRIFNILMNHPEKKLACYGTLIDSVYVNNMIKTKGKVKGFVETDENHNLKFTYELNTGEVDVTLYTSSVAINFTDIDLYEGNTYERILIPVVTEGKVYIANIYERKYSYE